MNLLDDFLFGSLVTYPEIGERFVRKVLRIIFGREFKRLSVTAQKVFYGADSDLHGARLDVYMEPEMEYEDGVSTLFLYTKGTKRVPNEVLKQLLCYMEDSTYRNAVNDDLKEIHGMVEIVRKDPETSIKYLRLQEKLRRSEAEVFLYDCE